MTFKLIGCEATGNEAIGKSVVAEESPTKINSNRPGKLRP